jgi:sec-independent protein translocase protein TatA
MVMGSLSIWHWLLVIVVVMLLFGKGRISDVMGDFAKGIKSFKKGMADEPAAPTAESTRLGNNATIDAKAESRDETKA